MYHYLVQQRVKYWHYMYHYLVQQRVKYWHYMYHYLVQQRQNVECTKCTKKQLKDIHLVIIKTKNLRQIYWA